MKPRKAPARRVLLRLNRSGAGFARATGGATAVEFALIGLPFCALLFGILELAMIFVMSTSLDNAAASVSRTIRTGAIYEAADKTAAGFRNQICAKVGWVGSGTCETNMVVEVRKFTTFAGVTTESPIVNGDLKTQGQLLFEPGGPGDIVLVRAYYRWPLITPLLSKGLDQLKGGNAMITSTLTFRNEPYA
jgi:Flp pilus assembly protein TadG